MLAKVYYVQPDRARLRKLGDLVTSDLAEHAHHNRNVVFRSDAWVRLQPCEDAAKRSSADDGLGVDVVARVDICKRCTEFPRFLSRYIVKALSE